MNYEIPWGNTPKIKGNSSSSLIGPFFVTKDACKYRMLTVNRAYQRTRVCIGQNMIETRKKYSISVIQSICVYFRFKIFIKEKITKVSFLNLARVICVRVFICV